MDYEEENKVIFTCRWKEQLVDSKPSKKNSQRNNSQTQQTVGYKFKE